MKYQLKTWVLVVIRYGNISFAKIAVVVGLSGLAGNAAGETPLAETQVQNIIWRYKIRDRIVVPNIWRSSGSGAIKSPWSTPHFSECQSMGKSIPCDCGGKFGSQI